jgi:hypothetical protein
MDKNSTWEKSEVHGAWYDPQQTRNQEWYKQLNSSKSLKQYLIQEAFLPERSSKISLGYTDSAWDVSVIFPPIGQKSSKQLD